MSIKEKAEKLIKSMPDGDRLGIVDVAKTYLGQQATIDILIEGLEEARSKVKLDTDKSNIYKIIIEALKEARR